MEHPRSEPYMRSTLRKFGITYDEWLRMWKLQSGACAICGGINRGGKALAIDHDHNSGEVRGLLCATCNTALGGFKDNSNLLRTAIAYLDFYSAPQPPTPTSARKCRWDDEDESLIPPNRRIFSLSALSASQQIGPSRAEKG